MVAESDTTEATQHAQKNLEKVKSDKRKEGNTSEKWHSFNKLFVSQHAAPQDTGDMLVPETNL